MELTIATPDDHFTVGPYCRVTPSSSGRISGGGRCPTVAARVISPAGGGNHQTVRGLTPTPDNHFITGPYCRVKISGSRRIGSAGGCPTIRAWIVSAAGVSRVALVIPTPDDHFTAGPDCRVNSSVCG